RIFRQRFGSEGFSALALGTADASSDHIHFMKQNLSAGPVLSFSRSFADASGARSEASFRLAFASPNAAECFFFSCERVKVPAAVDRSSLENHANGVAGIAGVMAAAQKPVAYRSF